MFKNFLVFCKNVQILNVMARNTITERECNVLCNVKDICLSMSQLICLTGNFQEVKMLKFKENNAMQKEIVCVSNGFNSFNFQTEV